MRLYGKEWTRREIEARVGRIEQIGGLRRMTLNEGKEAGTELIEVRTGTGLRFLVSPSKGLDISLAEWKGVPISWQSVNGDVHPALYDARGTEWLRTSSGGLLMTCGLFHIGSPAEDEAGSHGLHGRAHHTPAAQVSATTEWIGDELHYRVAGVVEETSIFGVKLRLVRELAGKLGDNRVTLTDRVENAGFRPTPVRLLYHFNFGFPLLNERTRLHLPEADRMPREPETPMEGFDRWEAPDADARERVYYHRLRKEAIDEAGMAAAVIDSPAFPTEPLNVTLRWSAHTLPLLVQWRMPGASEHALGLEPANGPVGGRAEENRMGGPAVLEAGGSVLYKLEFEIGPGRED